MEKENLAKYDSSAIQVLVGLEAAKTLSFVYNKPLIPVHHIAGHIYANS